MAKIIGISGRKQSGKNTVANFINGHILKNIDMIEDFIINSKGQLEIKTSNQNGDKNWGIFDVTRKDSAYIDYAERELWPYVKVYHFADSLKELAINLFDVNAMDIYGNNEQKDKKINMLWENMPENVENKTGKMTIREFLQHFGTSVMRKMKDDIWVSSMLKKIICEDSEIALIPDVRFPNEVKAIRENGGCVIRLNRDIFNDTHPCERALDKDVFDWDNFDYIIDNNNSNIKKLINDLEKIQPLWSEQHVSNLY